MFENELRIIMSDPIGVIWGTMIVVGICFYLLARAGAILIVAIEGKPLYEFIENKSEEMAPKEKKKRHRKGKAKSPKYDLKKMMKVSEEKT